MTAIDVSPQAVAVAQAAGRACVVGNIFTWTGGEYDTIVLLENNVGLGGTLERTKKLFKNLLTILNKKGQILLILTHRNREQDYLEVELTPEYRGQSGQPLPWIHFNPAYLKSFCLSLGLDARVLKGNQFCSLVRITRLST